MGDDNAEAACVKVIAQGHAHVGLFYAILTDGDAGDKRNVLKVARAIVAIEIVRLAVIGDEEVEVAVLVEVGPDSGEAKTILGIGDARGTGNIRERAVAIVVIEIVRRAFETARAALDADAVVLAGRAGAEGWEIVAAERDGVFNEDLRNNITLR